MKPRLLGVGAPPKWELFNSFKWQGRKGVNSNSCRARWGGWANEWKIENTRIVRGNYSISWIGIFMHKSTRENALASSRRYKLAGCLKQFTQDSPRWFNEKISFENWISSSRFTLTTNIKCDYSRQNFQPWELISILPTFMQCFIIETSQKIHFMFDWAESHSFQRHTLNRERRSAASLKQICGSFLCLSNLGTSDLLGNFRFVINYCAHRQFEHAIRALCLVATREDHRQWKNIHHGPAPVRRSQRVTDAWFTKQTVRRNKFSTRGSAHQSNFRHNIFCLWNKDHCKLIKNCVCAGFDADFGNGLRKPLVLTIILLS